MWSAAAIMRATTLLEPDESEPPPEEELEWCSWSGVEGAPMPSACAVAGPTTPSAVRPWALWKCFTASAGCGPNTPSAAMPSAFWTSDTEPAPEAPLLEPPDEWARAGGEGAPRRGWVGAA